MPIGRATIAYPSHFLTNLYMLAYYMPALLMLLSEPLAFIFLPLVGFYAMPPLMPCSGAKCRSSPAFMPCYRLFSTITSQNITAFISVAEASSSIIMMLMMLFRDCRRHNTDFVTSRYTKQICLDITPRFRRLSCRRHISMLMPDCSTVL